MTTRGIYAIIGFTLLIVGFLSLVLMLVGVQLSYLVWIDHFGRLAGFIIRLLMIIGGIVMIVLTQSNWRKQGEEG